MEQSKPEVHIPNKRYFTIGEVSAICGLKTHVLRYWEQEFSELEPIKEKVIDDIINKKIDLVLQIKIYYKIGDLLSMVRKSRFLLRILMKSDKITNSYYKLRKI